MGWNEDFICNETNIFLQDYKFADLGCVYTFGIPQPLSTSRLRLNEEATMKISEWTPTRQNQMQIDNLSSIVDFWAYNVDKVIIPPIRNTYDL